MTQATITIKSVRGDGTTVDITPDMTIFQLKEKVSEKLNIPVGDQKLVFNGRIGKDEQTMRDLAIVNGCAVHLVRSPQKTTAPAAQQTSAQPAQPAQPTQSFPQHTPSPAQATPQGGAGGVPPLDAATVADPASLLRNPQVANLLQNPAIMQMVDSPMFEQLAQNFLGPQATPDLIQHIRQEAHNVGQGQQAGQGAPLGQQPPTNLPSGAAAPNGDAPGQGFGGAFPPEMMNMLQNPGIQEQMGQMLQNPQMLQNMMQNPAVQQMLNGMGMGGLDLSGMLGQMQNMDLSGFAGNMAGQPAPAPANANLPNQRPMQTGLLRPPKEEAKTLYATQLTQMREFGFYDDDLSLRLLTVCDGNVQYATDRILKILDGTEPPLTDAQVWPPVQQQIPQSSPFANPWSQQQSSGSNVIHISSVADYNTRMANAGSKLVVVKFGAEWCPPCQAFKPILDRLSVQHPDVIFLSVDIDHLRDLSEVDSVQGVPTTRLWKNGSKVAEFSGANESLLVSYINRFK